VRAGKAGRGRGGDRLLDHDVLDFIERHVVLAAVVNRLTTTHFDTDD
jgi:hypothetical protein